MYKNELYEKKLNNMKKKEDYKMDENEGKKMFGNKKMNIVCGVVGVLIVVAFVGLFIWTRF